MPFSGNGCAVADSTWSFHKKLNTSSIPFTCFGPQNSQSSIVIVFLKTIMAVTIAKIVYHSIG